jgi:ubiquinone biosynthesis O-methyltransferase
MKSKTRFYDIYHKKNDRYQGVIGENNFTYFLLLSYLRFVLLDVKANGNVLDVGCGVGTLAFYLASKGLTVTGIDVSSRAVEIARANRLSKELPVEFQLADVTKLATKEKYDLVICTEVVEHIENDLKFLKSIHEHVSPKGYLFLSTPSLNAPLYRLGVLKKFDDEVGHLRRYTEESITELVSKAGFEVIECAKNEGILRNALFTIKPLGQLIRLIKGPLVPIFHFIDHLSLLLFGESDLIVIARKK